MQSRILLAIPLVFLGAGVLTGDNRNSELSIPLYGVHGGEVKQVQSATSQTVQFAPGGQIRVSGSSGDLIIEGSDEPDVQIDLHKLLSYGENDLRRLEHVTVAADKQSGSQLDITVTRHRGVSLETHIRVPSNSNLVIRQSGGTVSINNVTADIDAASSRGDIVLWLPDTGRYALDARSKFGTLSSDFAGSPRVLFYRVGERFDAGEKQPTAHVHLRVGFGGITIKRLVPESAQKQ